MPDLPARFAAIVISFAPLLAQCSWLHAQVLLVGAILTPGRRTMASVLRITGHARDRHVTNCRRVPSRAPSGGLGTVRAACSDICDPVRPSHSQFVKTSGLRWISLLLVFPHVSAAP